MNGQVFRYGMSAGGVTSLEVSEALQAIPTISLVMEQDDFSSSATGIYSNAMQRGRDWERPASIELINENRQGLGQFQIDCGVRIRGGASRATNNPKHSFRLFFRDEYGGVLRYPIFQEEGPGRFENLDLRTSQNYSWAWRNNFQNTFLRDIYGRDTLRDMGQLYTRSRYYHLYINGVYWGLFMSQERSEASYGETYLGGSEDDYDTIKAAGNTANYTTEAADGDMNGAWRDLWAAVRALRADPADDAAYFALQGLGPDGLSPHPDPAANPVLFDVDNLADYMLAIFFTGSFDGPLGHWVRASNNWFALRNRTGTHGFQFFAHDGEHSMGARSEGGELAGVSDDRVGPFGDLFTDRPPSAFDRSNPQ